MISFLYATQPSINEDALDRTWLHRMRDDFKKSGLPTFTFAWLKTAPKTLPADGHLPYWLYFYYSETKSEGHLYTGVAQFRVRVVRTAKTPFGTEHGVLPEVHRPPAPAKTFFVGDCIEEIRALDGGPYLSTNFVHEDGETQVLQACRNSIPPVRRTQPMLVVQRTRWELVD